MLDPNVIAKRSKLPIDLINLLMEGLSKSQLQEWITQTYGLIGDPNDIRRMNIIGTLRGLGYQVTGGKKGRMTPYQIVGWVEKEDTPGVEAWSIEDRAALEEIHRLPEITDIHQIEEMLSLVQPSDRHEHSALQIWSYELANNRAFEVEDDLGNKGIVIQKNVEKPVFRIIPFTLSDHGIVALVNLLGKISYQPIKIINTSSELNKMCKIHLGGRVETANEAVYDVHKIASFDGRSSKSIKNVTRLGRDLTVKRVDWVENYLLENVITSWRSVVEARQRQLSITRDYRAISAQCASKIVTLGIRHDRPACFQILDWMPGTKMVAQIVEKSLNFRSQPGGESGTSDFSLWRTCEILENLGVEEINAGHMGGGTKGLEEHKRRLLSRVVVSTTFVAESHRRR